MYKVISFGHRCSSAALIEELNLKTESYPFDWLVSKLDIVKDCIETKFVHFLNVNNYTEQTVTDTCNIIDDVKYNIGADIMFINTFYETDITNISTYHYKLALNRYHTNLKNDYAYYERCIDRLYKLFETDIQKYYIHLHPIVGPIDYENKKESILNEFEDFSQYIIGKTKNIFGIYFILIKQNETIKSIKLKETSNYVVFAIYCNENFADGSRLFWEKHDEEKEEVLRILKNILPSIPVEPTINNIPEPKVTQRTNKISWLRR
jgi:hypothetical protein